MTNFDQMIGEFSKVEAGKHSVLAPENWSQGRTLYGGMSAALCYVAAEALASPELPIRSALVSFIGPAGGQLTAESEVLRRGRSTLIAEAGLNSESGIGTRATFAFGAGRESRIDQSKLRLPEVSQPDACPDFWSAAGQGPNFAKNFEYRLAGGARPRSGSDATEMLAWVRHKVPVRSSQIAGLLALADSLPPAAITAFEEPAPISTLSWSIEFLQTDIDVQDNWYLCQSRAEHTAEGYSSQAMYLWDSSGRPVIAARQTVVIFY
ncbi:MAG: acyl-CoA thioesterase [Ponticaulis sp.]|nr:acyl-CoA thioesterase [Ponticaulis sp.]